MHQRSQTSIPPHVLASSAMELNLGVFKFLPTMHAKPSAKAMHPWSLRGAHFTRILSSHSDCSRCSDIGTWWTAVILITRKPEDPQLVPHAGIKIAQVLGSLVYIYGYEWCHVHSQDWVKFRLLCKYRFSIKQLNKQIKIHQGTFLKVFKKNNTAERILTLVLRSIFSKQTPLRLSMDVLFSLIPK